MSRRQRNRNNSDSSEYDEYDEEYEYFSDYDDGEVCFSDDDNIYEHSDEANKDDKEVIEIIDEKVQKEKEEQRKKLFREYQWQTPTDDTQVIDTQVIDTLTKELYPGLLEYVPPKHDGTKYKGAGFRRTMPKIVFGPTAITLQKAICSFFIKGTCTKGANCKFYHPVDEKCKFDPNCKNPKCVFVHSPKESVQEKTTQNRQVSTQPGKKYKHRICNNIFKIENSRLIVRINAETNKPETCRHGENCNFSHSKEEVKEAINANKETFKCKFNLGCREVKFKIYEKVIDNVPKKKYIYFNRTDICKCPRAHPHEKVENLIVRVHTGQKHQNLQGKD